MFKRILLRHTVFSLVQYVLHMTAVFTVSLPKSFSNLDLDRCEVLPSIVDDSTPYAENEPCSEDCYLNQIHPNDSITNKMRDNPSMTDLGPWTDEEMSLLETCVRIQGKSDRISCLAAIGLGKSCYKVPLPTTKLIQVHATLLSKSLLPRSTRTTTTTTTVTTTVTTTISEQSRPSSSSRQSRSMSIESSTTAQHKSHVHVHKKRKTGYSSKSSKNQSKGDYPADCNLSADNEKRAKFTPCDHEGPCGRGCPCVEGQVHCEKACACPAVSHPSMKLIL
jgi:hypothetical protein